MREQCLEWIGEADLGQLALPVLVRAEVAEVLAVPDAEQPRRPRSRRTFGDREQGPRSEQRTQQGRAEDGHAQTSQEPSLFAVQIYVLLDTFMCAHLDIDVKLDRSRLCKLGDAPRGKHIPLDRTGPAR